MAVANGGSKVGRAYPFRVVAEDGSPDLQAIARSLFADKIAAEVNSALGEAGIRCILLKGPAIADLLGTPERPYVDCDLLVPEDRFEAAEDVVSELGFSLVPMDVFKHDWVRHAHTWVRTDGAEVDLHRRLIGAGVEPGRLWEVLSRETVPMAVGGSEVKVLNPPARALVLALHAAKDGTRVGRPIKDLVRAIDRLGSEIWEGAAGVAERLGASAALGAGLGLIPEGRELRDRLGLPRNIPTEILLRTAGAPPLALGVDHFVKQRSLTKRLALAYGKTFPPRAFMRAWSPLARRGKTGLALAYAWRPMWLLGHIGPAVAAWFRAQRNARRLTEEEALRVNRIDIVKERIPVRYKLGILGRIAKTFVLVHLLLRRMALPDVVAALKKVERRRSYRIDPRRLGRVIYRMLAVGDRRARCLINSLVALRLLLEQGDNAELVIGLPESPADIVAHSWIEIEGVDVGPPPGRGEHEELTRYS